MTLSFILAQKLIICVISMVTKITAMECENKFVGLSSVMSNDLRTLRYELKYG